MLGLYWFQYHFYLVFDGFGINFDDFWWLGDRLEVSWYSIGFWGVPGAEEPWPDDGIWAAFWSPLSSSKQFPAAIQHAKYIMKHAGMKGYEKTRMQITKIRKIKAVTCSHYNRGSRIQDEAGSFAAGHPRGRRIFWVRSIPMIPARGPQTKLKGN